MVQAKMAEKKVGQKLDKLSERAQLSMKKAKEDMAKKRKVALRKPEDKMVCAEGPPVPIPRPRPMARARKNIVGAIAGRFVLIFLTVL